MVVQYPENLGLSAKYYGLKITEQTSCRGLVPFKEIKSPVHGYDLRTKFYKQFFKSQQGYFTETKDLIGNSITRKEPLILFEVNVGDIEIRTVKTSKKTESAANGVYLYQLEFKVRVPIAYKCSRVGDMNQVLLDTLNDDNFYTYYFPKNAKRVVNNVDVPNKGYNSEASLNQAWRKLGAHVEKEWRDELIQNFISGRFEEIKNEFVIHAVSHRTAIYGDKNKKGGFDDLQSAQELYIATIEEINEDFKLKKLTKYWDLEYQRRFNECALVWEKYLNQWDWNVTESDEFKEGYRKRILLNYIKAMIHTGRFSKSSELIEQYRMPTDKTGFALDLNRLAELNARLKMEFELYSDKFDWKRFTEKD